MDNNRYKQAKIYTIRNKNDDSLIYVGSTIGPLHKRWYEHKTGSKSIRCANIPLYIKMNETDINDWFIELHEDCPCERKEILNKREGEVIREIGSLNKKIAGRTKKEYDKEYHENNKEQRNEKKKEYRENNKGKEKEYYLKNKDNIAERKKEFYSKNKDKINEKRRNNYLKKKLEKSEEADV
jgi:hypothetical protein